MSKEKAIEKIHSLLDDGRSCAHHSSYCEKGKGKPFDPDNCLRCKFDQLLALLAKPEPCKACGGDGRKKWTVTKDWPYKYTICPNCKGTGIEPDCKPGPTECKDDCVYLEADGEIINEHIEKEKELEAIIDTQQAKIERLKKALEQIKDLETEYCPRCEGEGRLWADGKAHLSSYQGDTIPCGNCGGSGRILPEDAQEIAGQALEDDK